MLGSYTRHLGEIALSFLSPFSAPLPKYRYKYHCPCSGLASGTELPPLGAYILVRVPHLARPNTYRKDLSDVQTTCAQPATTHACDVYTYILSSRIGDTRTYWTRRIVQASERADPRVASLQRTTTTGGKKKGSATRYPIHRADTRCEYTRFGWCVVSSSRTHQVYFAPD